MSVYTEAVSGLSVIENSRDVVRWMGNSVWKEMVRLLEDNRPVFQALWGPHDCTFTSEYRHWIWQREHEGLRVFVLSGRRGTSVEVDAAMDGPTRVRFLEDLLEQIKRHTDG